MQDTLNSKKKGDVAFRHKEFKAAIDYYTQVIANVLIFFNDAKKPSLLAFRCKQIIVLAKIA